MSILRFTDGVEIDTGGELRPLQLVDGWYVVGNGGSIPVESEEQAKALIQELNTCPHNPRNQKGET